MLTECIFGAFNSTQDKDVLVPMGAIDGVLPGCSKYECDRLRSTIELVYNTPKNSQCSTLPPPTCSDQPFKPLSALYKIISFNYTSCD